MKGMIKMSQIDFIVTGLNKAEAEKMRKLDYTFCFDDAGDLKDSHRWKLKKGVKKFHKVNCGTSGAFMIEIETGEIYNIKAYGIPDYNKKTKANLGNIKDYATVTKIGYLHARRYNYLR